MDFWSAHRVNENTVFSCIFADTCSALLHTPCLVAFSPQCSVFSYGMEQNLRHQTQNGIYVHASSVPRAPGVKRFKDIARFTILVLKRNKKVRSAVAPPITRRRKENLRGAVKRFTPASVLCCPKKFQR